MDTDSTPDQAHAGSSAIFTRIVCGVDGTDESREAVAQVARLAPETARVVLCSVWNTGASVAVGWSPPLARTASFPREELKAAVDAVPAAPAGVARRGDERRRGPARADDAGRDRPPGGDARRRRVARPPAPDRDPARERRRPASARRAVLGADGAGAAERSIPGHGHGGRRRLDRVGPARSTSAADIAHRLGAELEAVVATGGQAEVDIGAVRSVLDAVGGPEIPLREDPQPPVDALTRVAPDLLVVGSRGLQGVRSLGSVSERVAHEARCSVLVVR